ncbi:hypothetical protein BMW23_1111 [Bodo saltans virus]|uniref:Uncharacterized protein n=1 Tax=Bodo saltans virus TaxID=2024608 RepID=A0A2H4UW81_9VIRU|nr:hypothetical protein QJ851_gp1091 [Bodo saltans virus]ATZ81154.1 hypothetical protein BMW23_1111 [Bodo saltans virus]
MHNVTTNIVSNDAKDILCYKKFRYNQNHLFKKLK